MATDQTPDPVNMSKPGGHSVLVTPGLGGPWLGVVVDAGKLDEHVPRGVEVTPGYVLVRCTDRLSAPRLVSGRLYLVLARFVTAPPSTN